MTKYMLVLIVLSLPAQADESSVRIGLICCSHHWKNDYDYNESNPGIYVGYNPFIVGVVRNSYDQTSVFVAVEERVSKYMSLSFGIASGYEDASYNVGGEYLPIISINFNLGPITLMNNPMFSALALEIELR